MKKQRWILASASPRRREILTALGLKFEIEPAQGEEKIETKDPVETVKALALQKALEVAKKTKDEAWVIGSDTVVACDGQILGKPRDEEDAFRMLKKLQGGSHMVYTGVAVADSRTGEVPIHFADGTRVSFYPMTDDWIRRYIRTGEPMDKAGAYAIQGGCMPFIRELKGEYMTVVGFPAARFYQELFKLGIDLQASGEEKDEV